MHRLIGFTLSLVFLGGCATPPASRVTEDQVDRTSLVGDTMLRLSNRTVAFFTLESVPGGDIDNARSMSAREDAGQGPYWFQTAGAAREVLAEAAMVTIRAQIDHVAPIFGMFGDTRRASGEVMFNPEIGEVYLVTGHVDDDVISVWIQDIHGRRVTDVVSDPEVFADPDRLQPPYALPHLGQDAPLGRILAGEHIKVVHRRLGPPDKSEEPQLPSFLSQRQPRFEEHYEGLGVIQYLGRQPIAHVLEVRPEFSAGSEDARAFLLRQLSSGVPGDVIAASRHIVNSKIRDGDVLDLAADELAAGYLTEDRAVAESMAWLARALGSSGDARYREILLKVQNEARTRAITRHARRALAELPSDAGDVVQYPN